MAENRVALPRVAPGRAPRRGFGAFCAIFGVLIGVLALGPMRANTATAGGVEPARSHGNRHAHAVPAPASDRAAAATPTDTGTVGDGRGTPAALAPLIAAGQPIYCGAGTKPFVALTFDDGPGPYTQETIDLLKANGMTATFFTVGELYSDPRFQGLLREEARLGAVGDHTWNHVSVDGMTRSQLDAQIARTRRVASADSGKPVFLFRPPLGLHDPTVDVYLRAHGMLDILWSIDSEDSQGASANKIYRTVRDHLSPGDIVLLHENRGTTQSALPRILRLIRARGLRTVTVPQLLTWDPPPMEQLRQHTCR